MFIDPFNLSPLYSENMFANNNKMRYKTATRWNFSKPPCVIDLAEIFICIMDLYTTILSKLKNICADNLSDDAIFPVIYLSIPYNVYLKAERCE